ncbi:hypothetical protein MJG53_018806 [Ovis ammon polii x Ovis aries]|uniref:Uncharacterized protein n=1 Tax=Ovis ammon polii x Ovis aries TaxID=2918886 RepID=A0ACB9U2Z7_9CETA|nr:hypothetical protein MJG53_018806 [Ovis ammon polii x Ovis aries]
MRALETRTDSPGETPEVPKIHVSTGEESSGSGSEYTQGLRPRNRRESNPERPPRNSHREFPFLRPPERVPEVPVPRIDSHHVCTWDSPVGKPRGKASSEDSSPFQRNLFSLHCLDVQAEDRLPPRVHVGQPCGKASWESIVGKTRGKTIDPLIHAADCETLLLPLWRKAQVHARIRDED